VPEAGIGNYELNRRVEFFGLRGRDQLDRAFDFLACPHVQKGDGLVLMTNGQNSKALGLEIIRAFANQYGWTEYPTDDSSLIWVIYLIGGGLVLVAYLLFRAKRSKRRELPGGHTTEVVP